MIVLIPDHCLSISLNLNLSMTGLKRIGAMNCYHAITHACFCILHLLIVIGRKVVLIRDI